MSHFLQRAAAAMLGDPEVAAQLDRASQAYGRRRSRLLGLLREAGIAGHGASGLNVWVPVLDEATVVAAMIDRGFAVRSGSRFRVRSGPGVRITVASSSDEQLDAVAGALIEALSPHGETRSG